MIEDPFGRSFRTFEVRNPSPRRQRRPGDTAGFEQIPHIVAGVGLGFEVRLIHESCMSVGDRRILARIVRIVH